MKNTKSLTPKLILPALVVSVVALSASAHAQEHHKAKVDTSKIPAAATKQDVTSAGDIKAIFDKSCVKCHGEEKPKAKLRLTSLANALKGIAGKNGVNEKVIEPGKGLESALLISVAHASDDEDTWMPPPKNKANIGPLTTEQIGLIRAWIDQGAK
jgi:mono/diheme cytochrome c family protein